MQSGERTAFQSVVGLGSSDPCWGSIDAAGEDVSVWVGVIVGLVAGKGVVLDVAVDVGGGSVQVAGKTTFVPVGTGLVVGGRANKSKEPQPVNVIKIRADKIQSADPCWITPRSSLRIQIILFDPMVHLISAVKIVLWY